MSLTGLTLQVTNGFRLPPPPETPLLLYRLMRQCWETSPFERPPFDDCAAMLRTITTALMAGSTMSELAACEVCVRGGIDVSREA